MACSNMKQGLNSQQQFTAAGFSALCIIQLKQASQGLA